MTPSAETGLLRAIIDEPDADDLRLIFADWLEENDESERAEFIRVQCELEKYPPENSMSLGIYGPKRMAEGRQLRRRERELLEAHWTNWYPLIDHHRRGVVCLNLSEPVHDSRKAWPAYHFRRGFGDEVHLTLADFVGRECRSCYWRSNEGVISRWCPDCHGSGRTGAHGPTIVRAAPIERVVLSDREPYGARDCWWWHRRSAYRERVSLDVLPDCLFDYLPGAKISDDSPHETRPLALDGASTAALAWAKAQLAPPCG